MSNAKKCDICGSYYSKESPENDELDTVKFGYYKRENVWETVKEYDMCTHCMHKLVDLIDIIRKSGKDNVEHSDIDADICSANYDLLYKCRCASVLNKIREAYNE